MMVCAFRVKQVGADTVQTRSLKLPQQAGSRVAGAYSPFQPSPITSIMPQTSLEVASHFNYQSIFDSALEEYKSKTGKDLTEDPLLRSLETCDTPDAVLTILRAQILGPGPSQSSHDKLTTWLDPTVNVINAFSATIGGGVGLAYPPAGVIFTGIGVLLSAVKDVGAIRGQLADLFTRIENFFRRLETYLEVPPTLGMTDVILAVMVEVLCVLAIATKEIKQNRAKMFLKKLAGRTDMEDALQRLEKLTLEEGRMAGAEALRAIHGIGNKVGDKMQDALQAVHDKVGGVENMLQGVTVMLQGVGNKVQGVDDRVKDMGDKVINGVEKTGLQTENNFDVDCEPQRAVDVDEILRK
ncbi:hypothetical protein DFH94DRAFT_847724 [Russula ochroleuca]|uniref:Fungal STAND N-terminal Goodbye domain-containing protein n=1 Tax=Russula ochroleuca TaxID=152965 RepID=A0A9P5JX54_9AGAM|nr:hypothetical protein DFH94DRAFT_847724 [Russula ochroleuca]